MQVRLDLERQGIRLLCNGARVECAPSGMTRSMSLGRKAYIHHLGQQGRSEDLVDIFDEAEPSSIGTVAEQEEFRDGRPPMPCAIP